MQEQLTRLYRDFFADMAIAPALARRLCARFFWP
jgi:hypothetical protein